MSIKKGYKTNKGRADLNERFWERLIEADRDGIDPYKVLEAKLRGADLSETFVTPEQLTQANSLKGAIMLGGTKHS